MCNLDSNIFKISRNVSPIYAHELTVIECRILAVKSHQRIVVANLLDISVFHVRRLRCDRR